MLEELFVGCNECVGNNEAMSEMWYEDGVKQGIKSAIENALKSGSSPEDISKVMNIDLDKILSIQDEMLTGVRG